MNEVFKITLLGTGSPIFDVNRQHSSVVVEVGGDKILVDCGRGTTTQMLRCGISPVEVDYIFITHHHFDHICDLGEFLMSAWHNGHQKPFYIYASRGTAKIIEALLDKVFAHDLAFSMQAEKGVESLRNLVKFSEIESGSVHVSGNWKVFAEEVSHGEHLNLPKDEWICFGFRLESGGKAIAVSGDTVACEGLNKLANQADCLVQCCYLAEAEITNPAFEYSAKYVIASSGQVGKIAAENKVKKLVLTHFRPKSEALMQSILVDVRKDFDGETILGKDLMTIEI
ncbi:MAG: MBL fold metallo-hydrolase [Pyrinomonadaceae bacterium]